jgi:hypothetical protein
MPCERLQSPGGGTVNRDEEKNSKLTPYGDPLTWRQMIKEASTDVKEHISRQPHVQRLFSFMPALMTRVSPFHFKNRSKLKEWPLVRLDSGEGIAWGHMEVVGELLVIYDETILFCLLALMTRYQSDAFETTMEELCQMAQMKPSLVAYNGIWKSIRRLAGTRIDLNLRSGKGRKQKTVKELTGSILSYADRDGGLERLRVVVNPYFLEMYADSFIANIDLTFRASLKHDVSKAFYRFFQGQISNRHTLALLRLARAINLDTDVEPAALKRKVRTGLKELVERSYLESFALDDQGNVSITKAKDSAVHGTFLPA